MASKLAHRLGSRLLRNSTNSIILFRGGVLNPPISTIIGSSPITSSSLLNHYRMFTAQPSLSVSGLRFFSTSARRMPVKSPKIDIGARARQMQARRLWMYVGAFSCVAGFVIVVLNTFEEQLVFYITPTQAMEKFAADPSKNKFRLGGLVLEGSVLYPKDSSKMEFVLTDLITDVLVRYEGGALPDLFREGHSAVVEGFIKPFTDEVRKELSSKSVTEKARSLDCYFDSIQVLANHDEKYVPKNIADALEKNKKTLAAEANAKDEAKKEAKEVEKVQSS